MSEDAKRNGAKRGRRVAGGFVALATVAGGLSFAAVNLAISAGASLAVVARGGGHTSGCPASSPCTLDAAIAQAPIAGPTTTINVAPGTYFGTLVIKQNVNIVGSGEGNTFFTTLVAGPPVMAVDSGTVTLTDMTIENAHASHEVFGAGGLDNDANLTLDRVSVTNNSFNIGLDGAGGIVNIGTLKLENSSVTNNTASNTEGCAGGISNDGTMTIENSTISNNTCSGIYNYAAGGITNDVSKLLPPTPKGMLPGILSVGGSTITGNQTAPSSCGCEGAGGVLNVKQLHLTSTKVSSNSARYAGGGIEGFGGSAVTTITGATITDNSATDQGGGIYNGCGAATNVSSSGVDANHAGQSGGGIYSDGTSCTTHLTVDNSDVSGNTAVFSGGGIYSQYSTVKVSASTLNHDVVSDPSSNGGGIYSIADHLTVASDTLTGDQANSEGGGVFTTNEASASIVGGSITQNGAEYGGGIYNAAGVLTIDGTGSSVSVTSNTAQQGGGGIYNGSKMKIEGSFDFSHNSATNGGGIYNNGSMTITGLSSSDSTIFANTAASDGGGIDNPGTVVLDSTGVTGNTAGADGGGVYQSGTFHKNAATTITGNTPNNVAS